MVLCILLLLLFSIILFSLLFIRARSRFEYRVLVCGSSGKSEICRMLSSGFEDASISVSFLPSQTAVINGFLKARKQGSKAIIAEFGYINPIWNLLFGRLLFRPNICIVSNVRHDNPYFDTEEYASSLLEVAPAGCPVFSSDIAYMGSPAVTLVAKGRTDKEKYRYLTEAALAHLGLSLSGSDSDDKISEYSVEGRSVTGGFGINDLESIERLLEQKESSEYSIIFSNRSDRPFRLELLIPLLTDCGCSEIHVIGDGVPRCVSKLRKQVLGKPIQPFSGSVSDTLASCCRNVVLIGGLSEQAQELLDYCRKNSNPQV